MLNRLRPEQSGDSACMVRVSNGASSARAIGRKEVETLIGGLRERRLAHVTQLRPDSGCVGLRIDLTEGLTNDGLELLQFLDQRALPHLVALSPIRVGDLCIFSEGHVRLDPGLKPLFVALGRCKSREFACLNELCDALLYGLGDPWMLLDQLAEQLHGYEIPVSGYATPFDNSPANQLNLLLLHGGYFRQVPDVVFDSFGVHANDLQRGEHKRQWLSRDVDFVEALNVERAADEVEAWNGRLGRFIRRNFLISARRSLTWIAHSTPDGWCFEGSGKPGDQPLTTDDLVHWLRQAPADRSGLVVLDSAHVRMRSEHVPGRENTHLRSLPYPFHHFLAFNSDIDWSTAAQQSAVLKRLTEELGLPIATSFYLRATSEHWVAAERVSPRSPRDGEDDLVGKWFSVGTMDTLHGLQTSINVAVFERTGTNEWRLAPGCQLVYVEGFLVASRIDLHGTSLALTFSTGSSTTLLVQKASSHPDSAGLFHAYFPVPDELRPALSNTVVCSFAKGSENSTNVVLVTANDFDPQRVARSLQSLSNRGVRPIVFTSHGGGANVLALGNLHAPEVRAAYSEHAVHDFDEEGSPYFLIPELVELGIRFFNPVGRTAGPDLVSIDGLTQPAHLKNGEPTIFFTRFLSTRHEAIGLPSVWCYGKSLPHAAALGFQISDVIQRLHWLPFGHGGILYTHFGHNVGNQVCDRLAWTEETHAAFERIARYYHPDYVDNASGLRLWVGAASSVLVYSWVVKRAREFISVTGSRVQITSWYDEALRTEIPALARYGTKLLHGITVYVENAACAEAFVDGKPVLSFTRNPADESGRESISFVDDSRFVRVFQEEPLELVACDRDAYVEFEIPPVPLAGVTHWSFELDSTLCEVEVGFRDARGVCYLAGLVRAADVVWTIDRWGGVGWRRFTYALAGRRPHPAGPACGKIVAIVTRMRSVSGTSGVKLRRVMFLRPNASLVETGCEQG